MKYRPEAIPELREQAQRVLNSDARNVIKFEARKLLKETEPTKRIAA